MSAGDHYRVAMIAAKPFPVPQGSQVLVQQTAQILHNRGHDVHLVVYGYGCGEPPPGLQVHRAANVPGAHKTLAGPSWAKPFQDLALARTLRHVIRRHDIDIVHAHNYEGLAVALLAGKHPTVYHAHTCLADELPFFVAPRPLARWLGSYVDTALPRRADAAIALHDRMSHYLIESGCDRQKVITIPPPFDPDFVPGDGTPAAGDGFVSDVLYTGNLDDYQNLALLVEAMALVRARESRARLLVATADPRPFPSADCRIPTPGAAAVRAALAANVIVACPRVSWSGYPIKLLNAMAMGKPMVACAGAAYGLEDRETALVVPNDDARAFADALLELMHNAQLRRHLGHTARHTALTCHRPESIAGQIESLYATLLGDVHTQH